MSEQTKLHTIEGVQYREVNRKADVGDYVIQTSDYFGALGFIAKVTHAGKGGIKTTHTLYDNEYKTLEPAAPATESDVIANLVRRVAVLEVINRNRAGLATLEDEVNKPNTSDVTRSQSDQPDLIASTCDEVRDLLLRKNADYGDSFSKQFAKYGVLSGLIRMDDKIQRLNTLVGGQEAQVAESLEDSLLDLCGYSLLTIVELRKAGR